MLAQACPVMINHLAMKVAISTLLTGLQDAIGAIVTCMQLTKKCVLMFLFVITHSLCILSLFRILIVIIIFY